jgi:polysaccharide biosynthesis/export protein
VVTYQKIARICAIAVSIFLVGCSLLPASGPATTDIVPLAPNSRPYALVKVTREVVETLGQYAPRLANVFTDRRPPRDLRFGIGDVVSMTIFEASAGGLFIPAEASVRPGNFITLPNQAVDNNGNISVPYAGVIRAQGRTQVEVQRAVVDALKNRAIEPQVVVALVEQRTSLISVLGEVGRPSRIPASAAGEHLLDAIARAGGPNAKGFDSWVMLEREGRRATVPFGALVYEPANNIYAHPDDTIYVYTEPQTFLAFGASGGGSGGGSGNQGQFKFDAWRISLAEAVAKAGGLNDFLADPAAVFLYRGETREVAERLGVECSKYEGPIIPIIYNVNFRDPGGYFLATRFDMRNKDVIYISNSGSVETTKFLTFLRTIMATVDDPIVYATNYFTLKAVIKGTGNVTTVVTPTPITTSH